MNGRRFYESGLAAIHATDYSDVATAGGLFAISWLQQQGLHRGMIVELGCGPGVSARAFLDAGYDVVACDLSLAMVERARTLAPEATITCGDLDVVEWPDETVAVVAFGEVLSYADSAAGFDERLIRTVRRVRRVLATGGLLLFDLVLEGRAGPTFERRLHHDREGYELFVEAREDPSSRVLDRWIHGQLRGASGEAIDERHRQITTHSDEVRERLLAEGFVVEVLGNYDRTGIGFPGWGVFACSRMVDR